VINLLINITTTNAGGAKKACVFARNDNVAGPQTITFTVVNQTHVVNEQFAAGEGKVVCVTHTATGQGFVVARSGDEMDRRFCNVDAANCDGLSSSALSSALTNQ
jgi:hypothetical protein